MITQKWVQLRLRSWLLVDEHELCWYYMIFLASPAQSALTPRGGVN